MRLIETIPTISPIGRLEEIHTWVEIIEINKKETCDQSSPRRVEGVRMLQTSRGEPVLQLSKGKYKVIATSEMLLAIHSHSG